MIDTISDITRRSALAGLAAVTAMASAIGPAAALAGPAVDPYASGTAGQVSSRILAIVRDRGNLPFVMADDHPIVGMVNAVVGALVWRRDHEGVALSPASVAEATSLRSMVDMADGSAHPTMPPAVRDALRSHLASIPGFVDGLGNDQPQVALDHHGYCQSKVCFALLRHPGEAA